MTLAEPLDHDILIERRGVPSPRNDSTAAMATAAFCAWWSP